MTISLTRSTFSSKFHFVWYSYRPISHLLFNICVVYIFFFLLASEILLSLSQSPRQGPPAVLFPLLPFPVVERHPCHWLQEPGSGFAPCGAYSSITEYKPKLRAPLGSRGQGRWFQPSLACSAYGAEVSLNLLLWLLPSLAQQITPKQWLKSTSFFFFFYVSWCCDSGVWAGLSWGILLFHMASTEVTWCIQVVCGSVWNVQDSGGDG